MYKKNIEKLGFKWIDIEVGLNYLNQNMKLYLKILENFLNRYQSLVIETLTLEELKDTVHGVKGLSSTLGMIALAKASERLHERFDMAHLEPFKRAFYDTLKELELIVIAVNTSTIPNTILVLEEDVDRIDEMIEILEDEYDILVALDIESTLSRLDEEEIGLLLTTENIAVKENFKQVVNRVSTHSIVYLVNHIENLSIQDHECCITRPFRNDELKSCLQMQLKIKNIYKNIN